MNYPLEGFMVRTRSADLLPMLNEWMHLDLEPQGEMCFSDVWQEQPHQLLLYQGPLGWLVLLPDSFHSVRGLEALSAEDHVLQFAHRKDYGYARTFEWGLAVPEAETPGYADGRQDVAAAIRAGFRSCLGMDIDQMDPDAILQRFTVTYSAERARKWRKTLPPNPYRRFLQQAIRKDPKAFLHGDVASRQASFETFIRHEGIAPEDVDTWCRKAYRFTNRAIDQHLMRKRRAIPTWKTILTLMIVCSLLYVLVAGLIALIPGTHPWSWVYWGYSMAGVLLVFLLLFVRLVRVPQVQVRLFDREPSQETMDRYRKEEAVKAD